MNDQRCYIKISKDKLIHNFKVISTLIPKECQVIPIIKANGYGLGSVEVAKTLSEYVETFAVAELEEARELRQAGIKNQILVFGPFFANFRKYSRSGIFPPFPPTYLLFFPFGNIIFKVWKFTKLKTFRL